MRARTVVTLIALAAVGAALLWRGAPADAPERSPQDAYKLAKVREVAAELAARETVGLDEARLAERARMIRELEAYADRGRFAQNDTYPGHAVPELVDRRGGYCALANLIHASGHDALLGRLAREHNHAYVADLLGDREFLTWLDEHGLSVEEAAYIMGPGYVTPDPQAPDDTIPPPLDMPRQPTTPPSPPPTPTTPPSTPVPPTTTPQGPSPSTPTTDATPSRRRNRGDADAGWATWWRLNRHHFFNLRRSYHDARPAVTPRAGERPRSTDRRARDAEVAAAILPFLQSAAKDASSGTQATALAAWTRAARREHAPEVGAALRGYLRNGNNPYRELILMKFGTVVHASVQKELREVLLDTPAGRRFLGQKGSIPERMRAYAAIALGHTGQGAGVDALLQVLDIEGKSLVDLRGSAIMALGVLGRTGDAKQRGRVQRYLIENLRARTWPDQALAMIPSALAATGDVSVVPELQRVLTRFRKPRAVRQSCALAIASLAPALTEPLIDTLIGAARRDPDDPTRRFAIVALGQIAHGHPLGETDTDDRTTYLAGKLARFYDGCFKGLNLQKQDLAWLYLSAGMFGRRFPAHAAPVLKRLLGEAERGASAERRGAALIGLGLLGSQRAVAPLRKLLAEAKDVATRGTAAEALGLLGDRGSRAALRTLVVGKEPALVRYGAAVGLGFLADRESLDVLLETFETTRSHSAQAAVARAIGEIGDRAAIAPLLRVAADKKRDTWTRRRAIAALGMIGQAEDEATVVRYQTGVNYLQATPALQMVLSLF